jgi:hypothetical protein
MNIGYYVTAIRDNRTGWLFGPIADHAVALAMVPAVRRLACTIDPWCDFDAFGTSSITRDDNQQLPDGRLNDQWHRYPI